MKALVGSFIEKHYGPVSFWENGGFGQTVPHAHLHASALIEPATFRDHGPVSAGSPACATSTPASPANTSWSATLARRSCCLDWDVYMRIVEHARSKSGRFVRSRDERRPKRRADQRSAEAPLDAGDGGPLAAEQRQGLADEARAACQFG